MFNKKQLQDQSLALIRIFTGIILIKVGVEIFSEDKMSGYIQWLTDIKFPLPHLMAYVGKVAELVGGLSFIIGFKVRWTSIPVIITMGVVTFIMGEGSITDNAFFLILLASVFLSQGAGVWSIENNNKKKSYG